MMLYELYSYFSTSTALLVLFIGYLTWKFYSERNLPPGPWGLPIVGYIPFLGRRPPEETFAELSKKYGPIISLKMANHLVVVLCDYESIKEAFVKQGDNFAGRPDGVIAKVNDDDAGMSSNDGDIWKEHRRFIISTMKEYGMGKLTLEPRIMEETHYFLQEIWNYKGEPFELTPVLSMSAANIICTMEFGKRFAYDDEQFVRYLKCMDDFTEAYNCNAVRGFFPWVDYLPFSELITKLSEARRLQNEILNFVNRQVTEHDSEYTKNSRKDLTDAYITERNATIQKTGDKGHFNDREILFNLTIMFLAGCLPVTTSLLWAVALMMYYPEIQKKVQKEIDEVVGADRDPAMSDKNNMVYTEAVLLEVQRYGSIIGLNFPHANLEETTLNGYKIPKRTVIMTNLWAVNRDPRLWDEPDKFKPDRFINKDGKIEKPEYLIPFGLGKRLCVGESLARAELFLYFTSLLQRFTLHPPPGCAASIDYESVLVRRPKAFNVCAVQRPGYSA